MEWRRTPTGTLGRKGQRQGRARRRRGAQWRAGRPPGIGRGRAAQPLQRAGGHGRGPSVRGARTRSGGDHRHVSGGGTALRAHRRSGRHRRDRRLWAPSHRAGCRAGRRRLRYPDRRLWAVFQPHTYSRFRALLPAFATSLAQADRVVLLDIYAAREADEGAVHSRQLLDLMPSPGAVHYAGTAGAAASYLLAEVQPGDVVITFSAGDGNLAGRLLLEGLRARGSKPTPQTRLRGRRCRKKKKRQKRGKGHPLPSLFSTARRGGPGEALAQPRVAPGGAHGPGGGARGARRAGGGR